MQTYGQQKDSFLCEEPLPRQIHPKSYFCEGKVVALTEKSTQLGV